MGFFDYWFGTSIKNDKQAAALSNKGTKQPINFDDVEFGDEISVNESVPEGIHGELCYMSSGVQLEKVTNMLRLTYKGWLSEIPSNEIQAVVGYGNNLRWENVASYKMQDVGNGSYETMFPVNYGGNINIAFKDYKENWDNNSGMNYTFENNYFEDRN